MQTQKVVALVVLCCCLTLTSGCFIPRAQVGPYLLNPVKNVRKNVKAPRQPDDSIVGFGFDFMLALHLPLVSAKDLFSNTKVKRKKSAPLGIGIDLGPGLWISMEAGYSLDAAAYPGKFVVGLGLSYRLGGWLAIGYNPYLLIAGSEHGIHFGMRHALTFFIFHSIFIIEPQYEFTFASSPDIAGAGFTQAFRVMIGVNLFAPFILLARKNM